MDLFSFIPFRDEMVKVYHGLTDNATHTSDNPVFNELKIRRYDSAMEDVADVIIEKMEHWVGWSLKDQKTAVGGMKSIRGEVSSFALLGMKIDITFGLMQETDINGRPITTVNGKAHTRIDSKGDLGESRRMLRMMLSSLDFEFRPQIIHEDDYIFRSLDPKGAATAFQNLFDETRLEHRPSNPKAKSIEFKKPGKQAIEFKSSRNSGDLIQKPATPQAVAAEQNGSSAPTAAPVGDAAQKTSKPKITVISLKKNS
ncbi:MAG: hypothetical protein HGB00_04830 [Chlorobiaceae bacterium]|nr:hypothetical protein [Chlorobiaceae bacterium]